MSAPDYLLAAVASSLILVSSGCAPALPQGVTMAGPETDDLLPTVQGYILMGRPPGGIIAVGLPTLEETMVRPEGSHDRADTASIHALSGPDAGGRIAYIEDHLFVANEKDQRHLLKTIRLDGTQDSEIFSRPGNAMWATSPAGHGEIGTHLAISPTGGRVAFLSELTAVQMPSAYLHAGYLEVWDVSTKTGGKTSVKALDEGLAWFPDGKRIAYVKLSKRRHSSGAGTAEDSLGKKFQEWQQVPSVYIFDVDAGTESFLHVGWRPVVSFDGNSVLVADDEGEWRLVDVAAGKSVATTWPGITWPGAIANPAQDVILCWALPTSGSRIKYTDHNSPLRGPKLMLTLKLTKADSREFQTVVPYIDPRTVVSFGKTSSGRE